MTLAFNNQLTRGRNGNPAYDVLQPAGSLVPFSMAAGYQTAKQIVVQPQAGGQLQPQAQQYVPVPVTMVEQNGRQIMAAVQAASWPTRQMALAVPSWQQLTAASSAAVAAAAAADNILPLFAAAAEADWRRPLIVEQPVFSVYDRAMAASSAVAAAAASSHEAAVQQSRSSYSAVSTGSKRSAKSTQEAANSINPPPAHSNSQVFSSAVGFVKKEPSQLSPVKKRLKENKDHYLYADSAYSSVLHSPADQLGIGFYGSASASRGNLGSAIIIRDDSPPLLGQNPHLNPPEVITILDSDDETPVEDPVKLENVASAISHVALIKPDSPQASPASASVVATASASASASLNTSGCPSVMPITPSNLCNPSTQSTPSRSHAASCITVHGDSDEDFHRAPVKQEVAAPGNSSSSTRVEQGSTFSRKNRLLAKAQSEWMLATLKEEAPNTPVTFGTHPSYSRADVKDPTLTYGSVSLESSRNLSATQQLMRDRGMMAQAALAAREIQEREQEFAEVAAAIAQKRERERQQERERERERDLSSVARGFDRGLAQPAHHGDYGAISHQPASRLVSQHQQQHAGPHRVEFLHPPAAHAHNSNYRHSSPGTSAAALAAVQQQNDFYAAVAAAGAPAAVYVTTGGYQPIAISHPPPAHHSRHSAAVLAPPPAHPLPAHVQPALFPAHPQMASTYSYAPLSPGKSQYLY